MKIVRAWGYASGFFLILNLLPTSALAFPEMVRHGYANCITCHVSPSGGGVMTPYGRELSRELLSTWGKEGESNFLYSVKPPEWLNLGGDIRSVQTHFESPTLREGRFIVMQADFEAAVQYGKTTFVGTVGRQEIVRPHDRTDEFISRRHYLNYRPSDQISLRVGKFQHQYGLNIAEHTAPIKRGLGWDQSIEGGSETYNLESAWLGDEWNFYLTGLFGRPDDKTLNRDKGVSSTASYFFANRYKAGLSYFSGTNGLVEREAYGIFGILGFSEHFFLLIEADQIKVRPPRVSSQEGLLTYSRLDYEFVQGVHGFLTYESSRSDTALPRDDSYGLGVQFFPRPHLEISGSWTKQKRPRLTSDLLDFAWIQFHYYL